MTNTISTEAIAVHTITNIILWSFSTSQLVFSSGNGGNGDGQFVGTGNTRNWLYTPDAGRGVGPIPSVSNVDLGASALKEACNISFGSASVIGATILLMRAATNTAINHPRTRKSSSNIAIFETFMLCLAWTATIVGMIACGLGYEPKTGWAVFGVAIMSLIGYAVCYFFQVQEDDEKAAHENDMVGVQGPIA